GALPLRSRRRRARRLRLQRARAHPRQSRRQAGHPGRARPVRADGGDAGAARRAPHDDALADAFPLTVKRALLVIALLLSFPARAQVVTEPAPPPWPDPKKFAKGPFASGEIGALVFFGRAGRYASAGPI